jgi:lantibiotic biosynthesis protein
VTPYEVNLRSELRSISESLNITSPTSFVFAGLPEVIVEFNQDETDSSMATAEQLPSQSDRQRRALVATITDMLYWNGYVQRFGEQPARALEPLDVVIDAAFLASLSESNQTESRWDPGWQVVQIGVEGEVQARKGECHRAPVPGEFLFDARPGVRPQIGDSISIRVTRESTLLQYGFYYCFSDQIPDQFEEFNSVRFYFNLRPEGAPTLLRELSGRLNRFQVPFRFKCPVCPSLFDRRDSGVLYVPWRFLQIASRCVAELLPSVEEFLEDDVPLFTKQVHRGVSMAEDPGELRSFGQYRCGLMAEGIVDAWQSEQEESTVVHCEEAIDLRFQKAGVTLQQPWLNPGSQDFLELPRRAETFSSTVAVQEIRRSESSVTTRRETAKPEVRSVEFLQAADRIGSRICRDAMWSGELCNWLEWESEPIRGTWLPVYRALGSSSVFPLSGVSLYSGTAGVSLFLARLFRFTDDSLHRESAIGSASQVLDQVKLLSERPLDSALPTAFYTGWLGAAWALTEVGRETGCDELIESGMLEVKKVASVDPRTPQTDVINGSAGLIVALIDLANRFGSTDLVDVALRHGEFLLKTAQQSEIGWSWETLSVPVHHNLTGYGHGVSGIVCAMAELYRVTCDERFANAVQEGLRYESHYFSPDDGNWHDHRTDVAAEDESAFQFGWCHGAPGVGMSRLRLLELGFDSKLIRRDLQAATQTTLAKLSYENAAGQNAFCLCHGLAGNSELPLLLAETQAVGLETDRDQLLRHVDEVARTGIELFDKTGMPWPCNTAATGETPTLFNGMSGLGYFYLRAFSPGDVPSVMLLRPA